MHVTTRVTIRRGIVCTTFLAHISVYVIQLISMTRVMPVNAKTDDTVTTSKVLVDVSIFTFQIQQRTSVLTWTAFITYEFQTYLHVHARRTK